MRLANVLAQVMHVFGMFMAQKVLLQNLFQKLVAEWSENDLELLKCVTNDDEICIYDCDVHTKAQSSRGKILISQHLKKLSSSVECGDNAMLTT